MWNLVETLKSEEAFNILKDLTAQHYIRIAKSEHKNLIKQLLFNGLIEKGYDDEIDLFHLLTITQKGRVIFELLKWRDESVKELKLNTNKGNDMLKFELKAFYDTDLSYWNMRDFKNENDLILEDRICVIFNNGSAELPYFKKSQLARLSKDQCVELAELYKGISYKDGLLKAELIEELLTVTNEQFFRRAYEINCLPCCDFTISGYSQGEVIKVWQVGSDIYSKQYLQNLFFDTPITCRLTISKIEESLFLHESKTEELDEFYLEDLLTDYYTWDKDQIIDGFRLANVGYCEEFQNKYGVNLEEKIKEYLKENLPKELDYK